MARVETSILDNNLLMEAYEISVTLQSTRQSGGSVPPVVSGSSK